VRIGAHLSISRGFAAMARSAEKMGCETVQVFTRSPRGGPAKPLDPVDVRKMASVLTGAGIGPLIVHAPYYVAPASEKPDIGELAIQIIAEDCIRAAELGAGYVVVHAGHNRDAAPGAGPGTVARRLVEAAARLGRPARGRVEILLENGAGARGDAAGDLLDWSTSILMAADAGAPVAACLDTAHLWAAGVSLAPHEVDGLVELLDRIHILASLRVVHLNDCSSKPGGGRDRHDHIGEGDIPLDTFRALLGHHALASLPGIVETRDDDGALQRDVETLRRLRGERGAGAK